MESGTALKVEPGRALEVESGMTLEVGSGTALDWQMVTRETVQTSHSSGEQLAIDSVMTDSHYSSCQYLSIYINSSYIVYLHFMQVSQN